MQTNYLSGARALKIARKQFSNLCVNGILGRRVVGEPVDPDDVTRAMDLLSQCWPTKTPTMHSSDICRLIDVQAGATIAACVALGFVVRGWYGVEAFYPHALIGVNQRDFRRVVAGGDW